MTYEAPSARQKRAITGRRARDLRAKGVARFGAAREVVLARQWCTHGGHIPQHLAALLALSAPKAG